MGVKRNVVKKQKNEMMLLELFQLFRAEKKAMGITERTIHNYEESLNRFLQVLEWKDVKCSELDKCDIVSFIEELQELDVRVETINHYLRDIRTFLNWGSKEGYIQRIEVKLLKGQQAVKETYTEDELRLLLKKPLRDNYCEWRSWAIINWILATGNRERTVCNVKMKDIDFQAREIVLAETKNKKTQIIPMSTELLFVLRQFVRDFRSDATPEDYLFCNIAGERLSENGLKLSIVDYNRARGVSRTGVHALRHTFAKYWIKNGGDAFRLQKLLGHSSLEMTKRYVNMFTSDLAEGFDEVNPLDMLIRKQGVKHVIKRKHSV